MPVRVKPLTVPAAGVDVVDITIDETYEVEGVGRDTVTLRGTLVANRGVPLLAHGAKRASWKNSIVTAQFTKLSLIGQSAVFGPVSVSLDHRVPSFGVVQGGKCAAAIGIEVSMPAHNLALRSAEPVQLQSTVRTVPPIGDEKTDSVLPVRLVDESGRARGTLARARVTWRELRQQTPH
jgi:hypothetical protein